MVTHTDSLKNFRPGYHKSIIFDDVDFNHFPRTGQIKVVDYFYAQDLHCRHRVATIPANIPKVFTCNEWPLCDDPAVLRRIKKFEVKKMTHFSKLYRIKCQVV